MAAGNLLCSRITHSIEIDLQSETQWERHTARTCWRESLKGKACQGKSGAICWTSVPLFHTISLRVDSSFRQELESFPGLICSKLWSGIQSGPEPCFQPHLLSALPRAGRLAPTTASHPCLLGDPVTARHSRAPLPAASPPHLCSSQQADRSYSPLCSMICYTFFNKTIRPFYCTYLCTFHLSLPHATLCHLPTTLPQKKKQKQKEPSCLSERILPDTSLNSKHLSNVPVYSRCSVNIC